MNIYYILITLCYSYFKFDRAPFFRDNWVSIIRENVILGKKFYRCYFREQNIENNIEKLGF
jgi:hypothetical protein